MTKVLHSSVKKSSFMWCGDNESQVWITREGRNIHKQAINQKQKFRCISTYIHRSFFKCNNRWWNHFWNQMNFTRLSIILLICSIQRYDLIIFWMWNNFFIDESMYIYVSYWIEELLVFNYISFVFDKFLKYTHFINSRSFTKAIGPYRLFR